MTTTTARFEVVEGLLSIPAKVAVRLLIFCCRAVIGIVNSGYWQHDIFAGESEIDRGDAFSDQIASRMHA